MNAVGTKYLQSNGVLTTRYFDGTKVYAESIVSSKGTVNVDDIPKQSDLQTITDVTSNHTLQIDQLDDSIQQLNTKVDTNTSSTITALEQLRNEMNNKTQIDFNKFVYEFDMDEIPISPQENYIKPDYILSGYKYSGKCGTFSLPLDSKSTGRLYLNLTTFLPTNSVDVTMYVPNKVVNKRTGNSWIITAVSRTEVPTPYTNSNVQSFKMIFKNSSSISSGLFNYMFDKTFGETKVELAILSHVLSPEMRQFGGYNPTTVIYNCYVKTLILDGSCTYFNYDKGIVATDLYIIPRPGSFCALSSFGYNSACVYATNVYLAPYLHLNINYSGPLPTGFRTNAEIMLTPFTMPQKIFEYLILMLDNQ